jgi:predicted protein tyrosine phosphatase
MITVVRTFNYQQALELKPEPNAAMISIVDPSEPSQFLLHGWERIRYFRFDDVIGDVTNQSVVLFDLRMAFDMVRFMKTLDELNEPISLNVHCMAGISRSGAVAYFANQTFKAQLPERFESLHCPNPHVVHLLTKAFYLLG